MKESEVKVPFGGRTIVVSTYSNGTVKFNVSGTIVLYPTKGEMEHLSHVLRDKLEEAD